MDSLLICLIVSIFIQTGNSVLYPKESETRQVKLLDGVWDFRTIPLGVDQNTGFKNNWFKQPLKLTGDVIPMPVPSSYNDITQKREIRDYVGWAWYDRQFYAPKFWKTQNLRVLLRFGSVHYYSVVYVNGINVVNHTGGHLPFEADVTNILAYDKENLVTVVVNNTLNRYTIPQGKVDYKTDTKLYPKDFYEASTFFDFFNYAGIHRSVQLYAIPKNYITDITVTTDIKGSNGIINYNVEYKVDSNSQDVKVGVKVFDMKNKLSLKTEGSFNGTLTISNATFWWPFTMRQNPGYQYSIQFSLTKNGKLVDSYYLNVGIRTIKTENSQFYINGEKFYFRGFGKHEDADVRGKGLDIPIILKDFNLIKWIGANAFRTSHYPYSEELMDQADAQGIVIIDECPAVGLQYFEDKLLKQHLNTITEMINRDKNRPSVVMWSLANEPNSANKDAEPYFKKVFDHARSLDPTRPLSAALNTGYNADKAAKFLDVLMINRYSGWYQDTGYPQVIYKHMVDDFQNWHKAYNKPIMISEYGADTVAGLHMDPAYVFSEDYQTELYIEFHKVFDKLISEGFWVGELIWNFADFMTNESFTRVIGNKKGMFTRQRQPKASARLVRCRYWNLAGQLKNVSTNDSNFYCPPYVYNKLQ